MRLCPGTNIKYSAYDCEPNARSSHEKFKVSCSRFSKVRNGHLVNGAYLTLVSHALWDGGYKFVLKQVYPKFMAITRNCNSLSRNKVGLMTHLGISNVF